MPANTNPIFTLTPQFTPVSLAAADTGMGTSAPTNKATVVTGGTNGTRVDGISFVANAQSANAIIRVFYLVSTTYYLVGEVSVTATTPSNTVQAATAVWRPNITPYVVGNGHSLVFTFSVRNSAETWIAQAFAGDY